MDYDVEKNPYSTFYKSRQNRMIAVNSKTNFLKSLHFGYFKICEPKWVTRMEYNGLQKWNGLGYKNSKNRYPQNRLTSVECILDMSPKNIQNGKCISLYNHRIYSLVCRYKTHEASHGSSRG